MISGLITKKQIQDALENPEKFTTTFTNAVALRGAGIAHRDQAFSLMEYLINHPDDFKRLIQERCHFVYIAEEFPELAKMIIQFVVSHPSEFNRLILNSDDLTACAKSNVFECYPDIFEAPTLEDARRAQRILCSNLEVMRIMTLLILFHQSKEKNLLSPIPMEILFSIAAHTSDKEVQSFAEAKHHIQNRNR